MTGPARDWYGLHITLGQHSRPWAPERGLWLEHPTADFRCRCGFTDSASGAAAVTAFVATIRRTHATTCPVIRKDPYAHPTRSGASRPSGGRRAA